ncbi:hypothetical protein GCM10017744_022380 [Streptomyces antimycoticus]
MATSTAAPISGAATTSGSSRAVSTRSALQLGQGVRVDRAMAFAELDDERKQQRGHGRADHDVGEGERLDDRVDHRLSVGASAKTGAVPPLR